MQERIEKLERRCTLLGIGLVLSLTLPWIVSAKPAEKAKDTPEDQHFGKLDVDELVIRKLVVEDQKGNEAAKLDEEGLKAHTVSVKTGEESNSVLIMADDRVAMVLVGTPKAGRAAIMTGKDAGMLSRQPKFRDANCGILYLGGSDDNTLALDGNIVKKQDGDKIILRAPAK
jgi:hypothetical protein